MRIQGALWNSGEHYQEVWCKRKTTSQGWWTEVLRPVWKKSLKFSTLSLSEMGIVMHACQAGKNKWDVDITSSRWLCVSGDLPRDFPPTSAGCKGITFHCGFWPCGLMASICEFAKGGPNLCHLTRRWSVTKGTFYGWNTQLSAKSNNPNCGSAAEVGFPKQFLLCVNYPVLVTPASSSAGILFPSSPPCPVISTS